MISGENINPNFLELFEESKESAILSRIRHDYFN
jgi:hypothetical protein